MQTDPIGAGTGANWWGLAGLAVIILGFALIFVWVVILPARRDARAFALLGRRRGWQITRHTGSGGNAATVEVSPDNPAPGAAGWRAVISRFQGGDTATQIRTTEFRAPFAGPDQGMVVFGPGLSENDQALAATFLSRAGGLSLRLLLGDALSREAAGLHPLPLSLLPDVTAFATPGAEDRAATLAWDFAPLLAGWRQHHAREESFPILIATPGQLCLRMRQDADPALLEKFVDLGLALTEATAP